MKKLRKCQECGLLGHTKKSHDRERLTEITCTGPCGRTLSVSEFVKGNRKRLNGTPTTYWIKKCKQCRGVQFNALWNRDYHQRFRLLLNSVRARSKKLGLQLQLTETNLHDKLKQQNGRCFYSGRKLALENGDNSISIDRIDSTGGYTLDNTVLCCWAVNRMKNTLTESEFLSLCKDISEFSNIKQLQSA